MLAAQVDALISCTLHPIDEMNMTKRGRYSRVRLKVKLDVLMICLDAARPVLQKAYLPNSLAGEIPDAAQTPSESSATNTPSNRDFVSNCSSWPCEHADAPAASQPLLFNVYENGYPGCIFALLLFGESCN